MKGEYKGKLIALEGPDGCGKSTQVDLLSEWLESEGHEIEVTREPTDNPLGQIIKKSLRGEIDLSVEAEALLFAGDRALHVSEVVRPSLEKGKIVVMERYIHSSLAYQTSRGLSQDWIEEINKPAIEPDLSIFIDVPPEVGSKRINSSRKSDTFEKNIDLQKKVRESYRNLAEEEDMPLIDGSRSKEEVHRKIKNEVEEFLHTNLA